MKAQAHHQDQRPSARSARFTAALASSIFFWYVPRSPAFSALSAASNAADASLSALVAAGLSALPVGVLPSAAAAFVGRHRSFLEHLVQRLLQGVPDPDRLTEADHHETQRRIGTGAALALGVDRGHIEQAAAHRQGEQIAEGRAGSALVQEGRSRSATVSFVVMALNDCPGPSIWVVSDICRMRIRPYSGWLASALTAMYEARLERLSGT